MEVGFKSPLSRYKLR